MLPTCISDDIEAAKAVNRRSLTHYAFLPNYRNYWKEAGYVEEMEAIERAIAEGRRDDVPEVLHRQMAGRQHAVRSGGEGARRRGGVAGGGVRTPVIVPSSAAGQPVEGAGGDLRRVCLTATGRWFAAGLERRCWFAVRPCRRTDPGAPPRRMRERLSNGRAGLCGVPGSASGARLVRGLRGCRRSAGVHAAPAASSQPRDARLEARHTRLARKVSGPGECTRH